MKNNIRIIFCSKFLLIVVANLTQTTLSKKTFFQMFPHALLYKRQRFCPAAPPPQKKCSQVLYSYFVKVPIFFQVCYQVELKYIWHTAVTSESYANSETLAAKWRVS